MNFLKGKSPQIKPEQKKKTAPVARDALLAADRNRWFFVSVGLLALCLLLGVEVIRANVRFANNVQVAWVKMSPNGTWDIDFFDEGRGPEFFESTIDYMLSQFVERRYSKIRLSIKNDYGYALQFMASPLAQAFMASEQFNAPGKVADFLESGEDETVIEIGAIDHFDSDSTNFGKTEGTLYRTNVFIKELTKGPGGNLIGKPRNKIVSLQWRIKSKEEIQTDLKSLKFNPIGLEIIKSDILDDIKR